jgi:hypothetical protein
MNDVGILYCLALHLLLVARRAKNPSPNAALGVIYPIPSIFEKPKLKDLPEILVLNAPESFTHEQGSLLTRKQEVDALRPQTSKCANGDPIVWFAYPKVHRRSISVIRIATTCANY